MELHTLRRGSGRPLVLVHGLGASGASWAPVLDGLAAEREVIAVDLPGFGRTPPLAGPVTIATLTDALGAFLSAQGLTDADLVGSSMGARMVLELVRRGSTGGSVVSLDPGGFWSRGESLWFRSTVGPSVKLVQAVQPAVPALASRAATRTLLMAQFSARPWELPADLVAQELQGFTAPSVDAAFSALVNGPRQEGAPAGAARGKLTIGWGRHDRVTLPAQAARAAAVFPDARLVWFDHSGHFPMWDEPEATVRVVLDATE